MTKIKIDREDKTIYVDDEMTPAELEVFLLEKAIEEEWVSVHIDDDKDPQVVTQGQKIPLNEADLSEEE
jgi:hypothetical protein